MAKRTAFTRLAYYLRKFREATVIFLKKWVWRTFRFGRVLLYSLFLTVKLETGDRKCDRYLLFTTIKVVKDSHNHITIKLPNYHERQIIWIIPRSLRRKLRVGSSEPIKSSNTPWSTWKTKTVLTWKRHYFLKMESFKKSRTCEKEDHLKAK